MSNCKNCGNQITWGDSYVKGDKPKNLDGSTHYCKGGQKENFAENYSKPANPKPTTTAEQKVEKLSLLSAAFGDLSNEKFDSLCKVFMTMEINESK